jgi:disulfide bond formation protein DsbB
MIENFRHFLARHPRQLLLASAAAALGLIVVAIALTELLHLDPCHLCIFQRLLDMTLVLAFGLATWRYGRPDRVLWLSVAGIVSLVGMGVAGFQSWEQEFPEDGLSCSGSEPNVIERLVEWLGQRWPLLFLATGFCDSKELVIFGLSLANWSFVSFTGFALVAALFLFKPAFFTGARS